MTHVDLGGGSRKNLKLKEYKKVCWSRKPKQGSPHLHIITTYGHNDLADELFCFWATGWRQLVYKRDTFDFSFRVVNAKEDLNGEPWKVVDLGTLVVRNSKGEKIKRGLGRVLPGVKYGSSRKRKAHPQNDR